MHFSLFVAASILATLSCAQSDNCTAGDVLNCFLSNPIATPFCISYLQIPFVTETVNPTTLNPPSFPTAMPEVSVETIDPTATPTDVIPANPTNPPELPVDAVNTSDTAFPTENLIAIGERQETTTSPVVSPTPDSVFGPIGPILPTSHALAPTPTCLSEEGPTASALISSACSCLDIVPGTTTVVFTAPIPTLMGLPGGNGTDSGNGTSIIVPSGRMHRSTRRHARPSRGPHTISRA